MNKVLLAIIPLAILAGGWFALHTSETGLLAPTVSIPESDPDYATAPSSSDLNTDNHSLSVQSQATALSNDALSSVQTIHPHASTAPNYNNTSFSTIDSHKPNSDVSNIGHTVLTDDQFRSLQSRLHNDPVFMQDLINEFRYNSDPQRGKRIAALLGDTNHQNIVQAAAEMAYSGDPASQHIGLDLLSRLQPVNSQARDIAIELLTNETNPELLVSTMNALATPTNSANNQQRVQLIDNLHLLSNHPDPRVRSHSISLLGRWNTGGAATIQTQGLTDQDATVRARSVSAFIGKNDADERVIQSLLRVAENNNEVKTTRQSALYALQKMQLSTTARARYEQAVLTVRRTRQ